jgi:hypothetical protein
MRSPEAAVMSLEERQHAFDTVHDYWNGQNVARWKYVTQVVAAESDSTLSEGENYAAKRIPVDIWNRNTDAAILEESITAAFLASCGKSME